MMLLEYLSQGELTFPQSDEREKAFGQLAEEVDAKEELLKEYFTPENLREFVTAMERLHALERQLFYENGFLTATMLALEVRERLERVTT